MTTLGMILFVARIVVKTYTEFQNLAFSTTFGNFGWAVMVTGSSLILYSRLHLILLSPKILRVILLVILTNAILFQTPDIIMAYLADKVRPAVYDEFDRIFTYFDIVFAIQEIFLSSLYIYSFFRFARQGSLRLTKDAKGMVYFLVMLEGVVIVFDVLLNLLVYLHIISARRMISHLHMLSS
jgi:hypothetical protein